MVPKDFASLSDAEKLAAAVAHYLSFPMPALQHPGDTRAMYLNNGWVVLAKLLAPNEISFLVKQESDN